MFERLKVINYSCFKECEVEFRKLTIFIGENASGKSMLINALLQVVDSLGFEDSRKMLSYYFRMTSTRRFRNTENLL